MEKLLRVLNWPLLGLATTFLLCAVAARPDMFFAGAGCMLPFGAVLFALRPPHRRRFLWLAVVLNMLGVVMALMMIAALGMSHVRDPGRHMPPIWGVAFVCALNAGWCLRRALVSRDRPVDDGLIDEAQRIRPE